MYDVDIIKWSCKPTGGRHDPNGQVYPVCSMTMREPMAEDQGLEASSLL